MARSDGVQMGQYWEVETDHEGLVPVKAGCGVSGRRERGARARYFDYFELENWRAGAAQRANPTTEPA